MSLHEIRVVDIRDDRTELTRVNVSRLPRKSTDGHLKVLGNQFKIGPDMPAGQASAEFRTWLWGRLQAGDQDVIAALDTIIQIAEERPVELACWCHGAGTCHAHVIARACAWLTEVRTRQPL